jgi:hypothetical protein
MGSLGDSYLELWLRLGGPQCVNRWSVHFDLHEAGWLLEAEKLLFEILMVYV